MIQNQSKVINQQIKSITQLIDNQIIANYKLWPTKYIAYNVLFKTDKYASQYSLEEKTAFMARLEQKIDVNDAQAVERFLSMYAHPVVNKEPIYMPRFVSKSISQYVNPN